MRGIHRSWRRVRWTALAAGCLVVGAVRLADRPHDPRSLTLPNANPRLLAAYHNLPLGFEANQGQADPQVKFLTRGDGYQLFLTSTEAVLVLRNNSPERSMAPQASVVRMRFIEANPNPSVTGLEPLAGQSHYFTGSDPQRWHTHIPLYAKVQYRAVYPGVDLVYYGRNGRLEYDLTKNRPVMLSLSGSFESILSIEDVYRKPGVEGPEERRKIGEIAIRSRKLEAIFSFK